MPQPRSQRSSSGGTRKPAAAKASAGARKPAAKKQGAGAKPAKPAARKKPAKRTPASAKATTAAKRSAASSSSKKPAATPKRRAPSAAEAAAQRDDATRANLAQLADLLARGVLLTGERLQEAMDDAVQRGRMLPQDAEELVDRLVNAGRQQTQDLLADIEQLLGRSRKGATAKATDASKKAQSAAAESSDRVLQRVDRARRAAGIGSFPILNYDDLTAAQIAERVADLEAGDRRKVRDYEKRNANRKSVLDAVGHG